VRQAELEKADIDRLNAARVAYVAGLRSQVEGLIAEAGYNPEQANITIGRYGDNPLIYVSFGQPGASGGYTNYLSVVFRPNDERAAIATNTSGSWSDPYVVSDYFAQVAACKAVMLAVNEWLA
jgi:hypothetical protein